MTPEKFIESHGGDYLVPFDIMQGLDDLASFAEHAFAGWPEGEEERVEDAFVFLVKHYIAHIVLLNSTRLQSKWNEIKDQRD